MEKTNVSNIAPPADPAPLPLIAGDKTEPTLEQRMAAAGNMLGKACAFANQSDPKRTLPLNVYFATMLTEAKIEGMCNVLISKGLMTAEEIQESVVKGMQATAALMVQESQNHILLAAANDKQLRTRTRG